MNSFSGPLSINRDYPVKSNSKIVLSDTATNKIAKTKRFGYFISSYLLVGFFFRNAF